MRGACLFVLPLLLSQVALAGTVIYVDDSAAGANNGSTWCDAFLYLQDARARHAMAYDEQRGVVVLFGTYRRDSSTCAVYHLTGRGRVPSLHVFQTKHLRRPACLQAAEPIQENQA